MNNVRSRAYCLVVAFVVLALIAAACGEDVPTTPTVVSTTTSATLTASPSGTSTAAVTVTATPASVTATPTQPPAEARTQYPVTITSCGRTYTFDRAPQRIVTTWPANTELLLRLGVEPERIVGQAQTDYNNTDDVIGDQLEAFKSVPVLSPSDYPTREVMLNARPDFVFADGDYVFDPEAGRASYDDIEAAGAAAFVMRTFCSETREEAGLDEMLLDLEDIGVIMDRQGEAAALAGELQATIADISQRVAAATPVKTILCDYFDPVFYAISDRELSGKMLLAAGGVNAFADFEDPYAEPSVEEVLARQPEAFICLIPPDSERAAATEAFIRDKFADTPAVKNDQVFFVPQGLIFPPHSGAFLAEFAARLHPAAPQ